MAAAPAPLTTTRIVSIFFPLSSRAFSNPAAEIMAVPVSYTHLFRGEKKENIKNSIYG